LVDDALHSAVRTVLLAARRPGQRVYAVHVWFASTVHITPAHGFTRFLPCKYVIAGDAGQAEDRVRHHFAELGLSVNRTEVAVAGEQRIERYVFPEQMLLADHDPVEDATAS